MYYPPIKHVLYICYEVLKLYYKYSAKKIVIAINDRYVNFTYKMEKLSNYTLILS